MSCDKVPVQTRLLFGFLVREGMRKEEALSLEWADLDLERGIVRLDETRRTTRAPGRWMVASWLR